MSIKLGIVGGGAIGKTHLDAARKAGVEVVALADINPQVAATVAKSFNIPQYFDHSDKLFALPQVQAVIIGVPNNFHAPLAIAAMKAGKDVLVEKPMAMNVEQCRQINEAARRYKRILQVGFVSRFTPVGVTARQLVQANRVGKVYHAKANLYRRRGIPGLGGWFTTKAQSGGGPLIDVGVHAIDLILSLMDHPKPVRISGKVYANFGPRMKKYIYEGMWAGPPKYDGVFDVEDSAHALVRFDDGLTLEINAAWAGNFPNDTMKSLVGLFGDKGGLTFEMGGRELKLATEQDGYNVDVSPMMRPAEHFVEQIKSFADCVQHRKQPVATGEHGMIVQSIIDGIYQSSQKDQEIAVKW